MPLVLRMVMVFAPRSWKGASQASKTGRAASFSCRYTPRMSHGGVICGCLTVRMNTPARLAYVEIESGYALLTETVRALRVILIGIVHIDSKRKLPLGTTRVPKGKGS